MFKSSDYDRIPIDVNIAAGKETTTASITTKGTKDRSTEVETRDSSELRSGVCTQKETKSIVKPIAWKINNHNFRGTFYLLTFHLLPQNASRIFVRDDTTQAITVGEKAPTGIPSCSGEETADFKKSLRFRFVSSGIGNENWNNLIGFSFSIQDASKYQLLWSGPIMPPPTTTKEDGMTATGNGIETTTPTNETNGNATPPGQGPISIGLIIGLSVAGALLL
jgi:hypothetical protein